MPRRPKPIRAIALVLLLLSSVAPSAITADADDVKANLKRRTEDVRWLAGPRTWAELPVVVAALDDDAMEVRAAALVTAMRLWDANQSLATPKRMSLVLDWRQADHFMEALARDFDIMPAELRRASLEIAANLGVASHEGSVPLLVAAAADSDMPRIRDRAAALAAPLALTIAKDPLIRGAVVRFLGTQPASTKLADTAYRLFDFDNPATRAAAVDSALSDLVSADPGDDRFAGAVRLLKSWHAYDSGLTYLAVQVSQRPAYNRDNMRSLYGTLTRSTDDAIEAGVKLLGSDHARDRSDAEAFLAADPRRFSPANILAAVMKNRSRIPAELVATLKIDLVKACDQLAAKLTAADMTPAQRLTAVRTVRQIGLHGDAIRPAVERLLNDPDDDIRYTAAEILERRDIAVRARIPDLLKELRSDDRSRRVIAACQLEALDTEPRELARALRRAVTDGNMPAR